MADTVIATIDAASNQTFALPAGPFWVSQAVGAIAYQATNQDPAFKKTTDSGTTFAAAQVLTGPGTSVSQAVWWDRQTPGDTGNLIHIAYGGSNALSNSLIYANYNIATDTLSTPVVVVASGSGVQKRLFITKSRSGNIIIGVVQVGVSSAAFKSSDGTTFNSITSPYESNADDDIPGGVLVNTGDANDAGIIYGDTSASELSIKMYDDSANTWTETAIATCTIATTNGYADVKQRLSDGLNILVFQNATDTAGNDMQAYSLNCNSISSPTVSALTNVLTNSAETGGAGVFVDQTSNDIYATYLRGAAFAATVQAFYKVSTDAGSTWSAEQALSADAADDLRTVTGGAMVASGGGWFQPIWFNDDTLDLFHNLDTDIEIPAVASGTASLLDGGRLAGGILKKGLVNG